MLLQRILTAIPLAIGIIWIILFQPSQVFFGLTIVIGALAGYEWAKLAGLGTAGRFVYLLVVCALPWLIMEHAGKALDLYVYAGAAWWIAVGVYLLRKHPKPAESGVSAPKLLAGMLVIPAAMLAMNAIHRLPDGPEWLLYGLMLVWVADSGAYFAGRRYGRRKLAPAISPGKTREGLYGALIAVALYSVLAAVYFQLNTVAAIYLLVLALVLTLVSVAGDLYESVLKRERGVKDSGAILPGHGGILDRIDSVLAAMPVFMAGHGLLLESVNSA